MLKLLEEIGGKMDRPLREDWNNEAEIARLRLIANNSKSFRGLQERTMWPGTWKVLTLGIALVLFYSNATSAEWFV